MGIYTGATVRATRPRVIIKTDADFAIAVESSRRGPARSLSYKYGT